MSRTVLFDLLPFDMMYDVHCPLKTFPIIELFY